MMKRRDSDIELETTGRAKRKIYSGLFVATLSALGAASSSCVVDADAGRQGAVNGPGDSEAEAVGSIGESMQVTGKLLRTRLAGSCVDLPGGNTADTTQYQIWRCANNGDGNNNQKFNFWDQGGGKHDIRNVASNKCLYVASSSNGAHVEQRTCAVDDHQRWWLTNKGNNEYEIKNVSTNTCMDLSGAKTGNGTKIQAYACNGSSAQRFHILSWSSDFWDGFDGSDVNWNNWSEQNIWVNQEDHCYVSGNPYGTRDVNNGSLKLRVKQLASPVYCSNWDKTGKHHPDTKYVASRIITKNKKKFVRGKWEARLKLWTSGVPHQFPAWWLLGDRNNEAPLIGPHDVCWCLPGSGEIDIFEHAGSSGPNRYTMRAVKNKGGCDNGDWQTFQISTYPDLSQYHKMAVELVGRDIYYLIDNNFIGQQALAGDYAEEMDAVLNYAKLGTGDMGGTGTTWTMEVDYVQHKAASIQ